MENILSFKDMVFVDLTYPLSSAIPTWSGSCGFEHSLRDDYDPGSLFKFRTHAIKMHEGIGTHMDAPAHCIPGGKCISEIELERLIVPCIKIDVSSQAHERYSLRAEDITAFEKKFGVIPAGCLVIVYTGWAKHWKTPEHYRNNLLFPSISQEAAEVLLEREIMGVGIDTLSPDRPEDGFPVHNLILKAGKYIIENIADAHRLPPRGAYTLALPLKIEGGTEAPLRLVGIFRKEQEGRS